MDQFTLCFPEAEIVEIKDIVLNHDYYITLTLTAG